MELFFDIKNNEFIASQYRYTFQVLRKRQMLRGAKGAQRAYCYIGHTYGRMDGRTLEKVKI